MERAPAISADPYQDNLRLGEIEHSLGRTLLQSMPRCLGIVIGNSCNIDCVHCYQPKNGDNLLRPAGIGRELRREFEAFYPYLSTLRLQGGEAFALRGFSELLDDVAAAASRPIVSVSTNGTLIDEMWAERIVRTPFRTVTISIDGAKPSTFAQLRRGAELENVLEGARRIARWKRKLDSPLPYLDCFYVVMRSTFREIPEFLALMRNNGIDDVVLQTVEVTEHNAARTPEFAEREVIRDAGEVRELHALAREAVSKERPRFRSIRWCGMESLFASHGLETEFLNEGADGLYPDSDSMETRVELCPNPWTTLFVIENGDVHLCFLAEPVGNLYVTPLVELWNSPKALAKRSRMAAGRYTESGCSPQYCSWRNGHKAPAPVNGIELMGQMRVISERLKQAKASRAASEVPNGLTAVRRMLEARDRLIADLETELRESCDLLEAGQRHIDHLESKAAKAVADYQEMEKGRRTWVSKLLGRFGR